MARKTRLEYPGACYHVINRGNYRRWVFEEDGAKDAFEQCLAEGAARSGWVVHAWVVMGNHFHLALETPEGNLCAGMQWLQTTYAARFNRLRRERGHLFEGRYKAIAVERGEALGRVCHYIDLNPVRAGVVGVDQVESYRFGSFARLMKPKQRPVWLDVSVTLAEAGGLSDTPRGRKAYREFLGWLVEEIKAGREKAYRDLSKGWALGGEDFRQDLRQRYGEHVESERAMDPTARTTWRQQEWRARLESLVRRLSPAERSDTRSSAVWKAVVAERMKSLTEATNAWLATELGIGSAPYVSKQAALARAGKLGPVAAELRQRFHSKD